VTDVNIGGVQNPQQPATSGVYTFSLVRDDIIRDAMQNLGLLEESEIPTAREITDCARKLNMIVKQLAGRMDKAPGWKMWQRERGDLFLSTQKFSYDLGQLGDHCAGGVTGRAEPVTYNATNLGPNLAPGATVLPVTSTVAMNINDFIGILIGADLFWTTISAVTAGVSVTIPAPGLPAAAAGGTQIFNYTRQVQRPVEIETANLHQIDGTDTPLTMMTLPTYEALPNKVQPTFTQDPTAIYYEPRTKNLAGRLYIDCAGAQDVTKIIHFVFLREAQDFVNPGDLPDFPQEYYNLLCWDLTFAIHPMFDCDWTPAMAALYARSIGPAREQTPSRDESYFQPEDPDQGY
jgi:hypothetical protein